MLTVQNVTKNFGSFCALEDINLEFENGVYGLLAPNGAGKTTLIKMLVTLLYPTRGEILYNGMDIVQMDEQYRDVLGYLPQTFGYYKNYTPVQFLKYIAALKGIQPKRSRERIRELLEIVALGHVANKKMKKFSGGMIQRVGIAQAMLNDPRIVILDEPTAGLDPKERVRFRNLLAELGRDRIVILSTHIVSDVESVANDIILIKDKKVLLQDTGSNLCKTIHGQVYEARVAYGQAGEFRSRIVPLSERQEAGDLIVRFISRENPADDWKPVTPTLEDVFLYIYRDEAERE